MNITLDDDAMNFSFDTESTTSIDSMTFNHCRFKLTQADIDVNRHEAILAILDKPDEWNLRAYKDGYELWNTMFPRELAELRAKLERKRASLGFDVEFSAYAIENFPCQSPQFNKNNRCKTSSNTN